MNRTDTAPAIRSQRDAIERELAYCRQTQSWAPMSTRSRWIPELAELLAAIDADAGDDEIVRLAEAARSRAKELATEKANQVVGLADVEITHRLEDAGVEVPEGATLADLIAACREHDIKISPGADRDGIEIAEGAAVAYALTRDWDVEWIDCVTVPLVDDTAEAAR